jgi:hypothetical protein
MSEVAVIELKRAIESQHGGTATLAQSVPVKDTFEGATVWEGIVHVFDLAGHPKATRAYAWSSPIEGSTKRRFFSVLHTDKINSPVAAVRAAIVAEHRTKSYPRRVGRHPLERATATSCPPPAEPASALFALPLGRGPGASTLAAQCPGKRDKRFSSGHRVHPI